MDVIKAIEREYMKEDLPEFRAGDTVKVHVKVVEGSNERIQIFEGVVLRYGDRRTLHCAQSYSRYWCRADFPNATKSS